MSTRDLAWWTSRLGDGAEAALDGSIERRSTGECRIALRRPKPFARERSLARAARRAFGWFAAGALALAPTAYARAEDSAPGRPRQVPDELPADLPTRVPAGLPADLLDRAPASDEVVALGRALFFDSVLSADRSVSCSSCHDPRAGFADPNPASVGIGGQLSARHSPSLYNRALGTSFFWDGRATTLEQQVLEPIANEREMGESVDAIVRRLDADPVWRTRFQTAFRGAPTRARLASALAAFVRRLTHGDSGVDRFRRGEYGALSDEARAGMWIFESSGRCWKCHSGPNFSDEAFHNTGVGALDGQPRDGRFAISGVEAERGAFKTPTLRGLALTAPYMHDGSVATLAEVVEFYRRGGNENRWLDPEMKPLELDDRGAAALVAFLEALSDSASAVGVPVAESSAAAESSEASARASR